MKKKLGPKGITTTAPLQDLSAMRARFDRVGWMVPPFNVNLDRLISYGLENIVKRFADAIQGKPCVRLSEGKWRSIYIEGDQEKVKLIIPACPWDRIVRYGLWNDPALMVYAFNAQKADYIHHHASLPGFERILTEEIGLDARLNCLEIALDKTDPETYRRFVLAAFPRYINLSQIFHYDPEGNYHEGGAPYGEGEYQNKRSKRSRQIHAYSKQEEIAELKQRALVRYEAIFLSSYLKRKKVYRIHQAFDRALELVGHYLRFMQLDERKLFRKIRQTRCWKNELTILTPPAQARMIMDRTGMNRKSVMRFFRPVPPPCIIDFDSDFPTTLTKVHSSSPSSRISSYLPAITSHPTHPHAARRTTYGQFPQPLFQKSKSDCRIADTPTPIFTDDAYPQKRKTRRPEKHKTKNLDEWNEIEAALLDRIAEIDRICESVPL